MSDIQTPADPKTAITYRAAKAAVIVLSALIILALIGLVAGAILKLSGRSTHVLGGTAGSSAFVLPPGATIVGTDSQPGRLVLHVRSGAGDEIDIVSTDDGHLIAQIKAPPPPVPPR
ncbi:MAG: hypothetical protein WDN03_16905 [Rhizomicrobium sp.]